jgi:hypothetical protein
MWSIWTGGMWSDLPACALGQLYLSTGGIIIRIGSFLKNHLKIGLGVSIENYYPLVVSDSL